MAPWPLGIAQKGQHERMAVDDAGGRRPQGGGAGKRRLELSRALGRPELQLVHAGRSGIGADRRQGRALAPRLVATISLPQRA